MLNEYTDLQLECMRKDTSIQSCDPLGDFKSPQTLGESIIALAGMYFVCYALALLFMKMLSRKFE